MNDLLNDLRKDAIAGMAYFKIGSRELLVIKSNSEDLLRAREASIAEANESVKDMKDGPLLKRDLREWKELLKTYPAESLKNLGVHKPETQLDQRWNSRYLSAFAGYNRVVYVRNNDGSKAAETAEELSQLNSDINAIPGAKEALEDALEAVNKELLNGLEKKPEPSKQRQA